LEIKILKRHGMLVDFDGFEIVNVIDIDGGSYDVRAADGKKYKVSSLCIVK